MRRALVFSIVVISASFWRSDAAVQRNTDAAAARGPAFQGVASCTAAGCHNKEAPLGKPGAEYLTWLVLDPHAKAYEVLFEPRSRRMTELLHADPPEKNGLCLRCHASEAPAPRIGSLASAQDGVACESCHGAAEKWLGPHSAADNRAWKNTGAQDRQRLYGYVPLQNLTVRAQTCVRCHVGQADADVNHDLIAAGHPWLHFEFGSYLANYPKHWTEKGENARKDFEARAWLVGQVVAAQATLNLLAQRASAKDKPWPEFAEYDCFACHHDLTDQKRRRGPGHVRGRPGALPWNDWYLSMLPMLEQARPEGTTPLPLGDLKSLRDLMQQPLPDRARVAKLAGNAADRFQQGSFGWDRSRLEAAHVQRWLQGVNLQANELSDATWDRAAQTYLALAALGQAEEELQGKPSPERKEKMQMLRAGLGFPALFDSPRGYDPAKLQR